MVEEEEHFKQQVQKMCNPRLPIFISDFAEKQAQSHLW